LPLLPGAERWKAQVTLFTTVGVFTLETSNLWEATGNPS
jgi:hypothetical protein